MLLRNDQRPICLFVAGRRIRSSWEWRDPLDAYEHAVYKQHANDQKANIFAKSAEVRKASTVSSAGFSRRGSTDIMTASPSELALAANARAAKEKGQHDEYDSSPWLREDYTRHKEIDPTLDHDGERKEEGKREDGDECYEYVYDDR